VDAAQWTPPKITPASIGALRALKASDQYEAFTLPALNTPVFWAGPEAIFLTLRGAVVSAPQQNGHMYLDQAPDVGGSPGTFQHVGGFTTDRNNQTAGTGAGTVQSGGPNTGGGGLLAAIIPPGSWWQISTLTAAGYSAPTFLFESAVAFRLRLGAA
jgi:hypothetical protein